MQPIELTDLARERIGLLRQHLQAVRAGRTKVKFSMDSWISTVSAPADDHLCGTTACLAGHAVLLWDDEIPQRLGALRRGEAVDQIPSMAWAEGGAKALDIPYDNLGVMLFHRMFWPMELPDTLEDADDLNSAIELLGWILEGKVANPTGHAPLILL